MKTSEAVLNLLTTLTQDGIPPSYQRIGRELGITRQRVEQILRPLKQAGLLPDRRDLLAEQRADIALQAIAALTDETGVPPTVSGLAVYLDCSDHHARQCVRRLRADGRLHPTGRWLVPSSSTPYTDEDWFWSRVDQSRGEAFCWPWQGATASRAGYGHLCWRGHDALAHRIAYELSTGEAPPTLRDDGEPMCIRHVCDVPICCNPAHLSLGTVQENMLDRERRGRGGKAQLDANDVRQIRTMLADGDAPADIAARYEISINTVSRIHSGKSYRWVI